MLMLGGSVEIAVRKRFKVVPTDNGGAMINKLARVYWCDSCSFRTTTLELSY
jgi:hypothetical protein